MLPEIKDAKAFDALMVEIWGDGALHHALYDKWSNARDVAEASGAVRLYANKRDGASGYTYRFADGSKVWIGTDGNACALPSYHVAKT